ncbi:DUF6745 domain-containing protein [Nostoc sp. FACHB-280]|uniref:DUF6745 domain-containing protein n=1 Tax=Nostoc sp. FACHB-280 TaxID=2692839 RepID=UPI00168BC0BB|nr:hypothetical protein [Nostoc sp. FACHB-280]MBD2495189.1 hypothetical protein [Nostoc sp. FACHB-280]
MSADRLTPEQRALISQYREKWQHLGLSREPINQHQAMNAVQAIYTALGLNHPEIIIVDSPNAVFEYIWNLRQADSYSTLGNPISSSEWRKIYNNLQLKLFTQLPIDLQRDLQSAFENHLAQEYANLLQRQLENKWINIFSQQVVNSYHRPIKEIFASCYKPESLIAGSSYFDFCVHTFNYHQLQEQIAVLEEFVINCGWTFLFQNVAIISNRPTQILIDQDNHIHAENTPAITFKDGYRLYANHGQIDLEPKRQRINNFDWRPLLDKMNAVEIDSWEEYQLLRVVNKINVQPMQFLKATNPSTGEVYVSKVSMRFTSAIEAVQWVNRNRKSK